MECNIEDKLGLFQINAKLEPKPRKLWKASIEEALYQRTIQLLDQLIKHYSLEAFLSLFWQYLGRGWSNISQAYYVKKGPHGCKL